MLRYIPNGFNYIVQKNSRNYQIKLKVILIQNQAMFQSNTKMILKTFLLLAVTMNMIFGTQPINYCHRIII